jgi:hypothetical protein
MKNFLSLLTLAASAAVADAKLIVMPPTATKGTDVAIVWIHGMDCDNAAYQTIAAEVQRQGAEKGQRIWIGLPDFIFDAPEPILIDHYVSDTMKELVKEGFTGDNYVMAGHSLGGVMAQQYSNKHSDTFKAQILMGSTLTRDNLSISDDGSSHYDYKVPTLTIGGTKDGLMRISRIAENFWHSHVNINSDQSKLFPVMALEGVSHAQFMSGKPPFAVRNRDLKPDVSEDKAHQETASNMVQFINQIVFDKKETLDIKSSTKVIQPLVDALVLEGNYQTKPPCYNTLLVNPTDPTCQHGAPWHVENTQRIMGGDLSGHNMKIVNDDNFHRVDSVNPVHLPEVDSSCAQGAWNCNINSLTVSENIYGQLDKMDTGYYAVAASEMKTKISSRQRIQQHAGVTDADFHEQDEVGNRCADINDYAIKWAYDNLPKAAKANYDNYGQKLVTGDDMGPYNEGPLWIWTYMSYKQSKDKTQMVVRSPMMRTPTDYFISAAAGFHYCKVLSPFKAMEWMYTDALFDNNGIKNANDLDDDMVADYFLQ